MGENNKNHQFYFAVEGEYRPFDGINEFTAEEVGTCKTQDNADYKIRLVNEYCELKNRIEKIHETVVKYKAHTLDFDMDYEYFSLLMQQENCMTEYLHILEIRMEMEKIKKNKNVCSYTGKECYHG